MTGGRFERKFLVQDLDLREIEMLVRLHPALFHQPFPPRRVNNVYFDTPGFGSFLANVNGVARRSKLRIRWYGDAFGAVAGAVLERKAKAGLFGTKEAFPLPPFELERGVTASDLGRVLAGAPLPPAIRAELCTQSPVLVNGYRRSYHLSADARFRLTLDSEIGFLPFDRLGCSFAHEHSEPGVVVELKYDERDDLAAERIASAFPFRVTKSSKYATGIERLLT